MFFIIIFLVLEPLCFIVQETTAAAFLTAAFASASGTSGAASSEQMAQETDVSTLVTDDHIISRDAGQSLNSNTVEDRVNHKDGSKVTLFCLGCVLIVFCWL